MKICCFVQTLVSGWIKTRLLLEYQYCISCFVEGYLCLFDVDVLFAYSDIFTESLIKCIYSFLLSLVNSFLAYNFAKSLNPVQVRQNVGPDLVLNWSAL